MLFYWWGEDVVGCGVFEFIRMDFDIWEFVEGVEFFGCEGCLDGFVLIDDVDVVGFVFGEGVKGVGGDVCFGEFFWGFEENMGNVYGYVVVVDDEGVIMCF